MFIHVECLPDETLAKQIGFTRKQIKHHQGKSRVFADLKRKTDQLAMVDEDPGSARSDYEKQFVFQEEVHGIKYFIDPARNNKIFILKIKLEDWILAVCKRNNINIDKYGLPDRANDLHEVINNRLTSFERLISDLIQNNNQAILQLKNWLNSK